MHKQPVQQVGPNLGMAQKCTKKIAEIGGATCKEVMNRPASRPFCIAYGEMNKRPKSVSNVESDV